MKPCKNRQEAKRLLKEFLKQLRSFLVPDPYELTLEKFMRIESKKSSLNQNLEGINAKYF